MTREEIIRNLEYTMEKHKNDTVNTFGTNISAMCKAILDYLEQEPKTDVLDKIRAEIIENSIEDYKYHGCGTDELIIETSEVLNILDKYKAESEIYD